MSDGPFSFFWAEVIRKPCPTCQHPTAVGFARNDPGAAAREPTPCVLCVKAELDNAVQFARGEIGYPLTERGPCVSCGAPHRLYGPKGHAQCDPCVQAAAGTRAAQPRANHESQVPQIPVPRQAQAEELEATLF